MLNNSTSHVVMDVLFDLLFSVLILFFLFFLIATFKKSESENQNVQNDNNILITMKWPTDNDMDLWLLLPDGRKVGYSSRDKPPAHLDVDVVVWRRYQDETGQELTIESNEEIITVRGVLEGEYAVNTFYFNPNAHIGDVETEITVQNVKTGTVIYTGKKQISLPRSETHFVKFTVRKDTSVPAGYVVEDVYTDRPRYFLKELSTIPHHSMLPEG